MYEIGEIRLRTGDLAGAEEAFRRADEFVRRPEPGLSLLHLARATSRPPPHPSGKPSHMSTGTSSLGPSCFLPRSMSRLRPDAKPPAPPLPSLRRLLPCTGQWPSEPLQPAPEGPWSFPTATRAGRLPRCARVGSYGGRPGRLTRRREPGHFWRKPWTPTQMERPRRWSSMRPGRRSRGWGRNPMRSSLPISPRRSGRQRDVGARHDDRPGAAC